VSATAVNSPLPIPVVTEADIAKVEEYLGVSYDEPRRQILRSNDSFDVQACPGSGKTTLLVAKLAALADKWPHASRGICVLSHTNVARLEIEKKLGGTPVGRRLLAYPHFVGTIHGFVNEFLALPLLRSEGHHVILIDNDACFGWVKQRVMSWPNQKRLGNLPHKERTLDAGIWALVGAGELIRPAAPAGINDDQWAVLLRAKGEAVRRGLWYYADMFAWAERLLAKHAKVAEFARWRFPAVFLDEAQDTSELQGALLNRIFPTSACDLRQRFGDSNQAIYDSGQHAATTDPFPADGYRSLPNSQRFGADIAAKVHSLAPAPPSPSLAGEGPRANLLPGALDSVAMPHTIFLFAPKSAQQVLPAFGCLLVQTFPDEVLRCEAFSARAIGRVGKPDADEEKVPKHLGDYWAAYEPRAAKLEPRPEHLVDYVRLAQRRRVATIDCADSISMVIRGICELIGTVRAGPIPRGGRTARWLWEALRVDESSVVSLRRLLWEWCIESTPIVEQGWTDKVEELRRALDPVIGAEWNQDAGAFCQWPVNSTVQTAGQESKGRAMPNSYRFSQGKRFVDIEVGTIHGAKGQTHTATLVLETFSWAHDLEDVTPWLLGAKRGAPGEGPRRLERLRLVYTAMTRPSHLLCLAMRADVIRQGGEEAVRRQKLKNLGWNVEYLGVGNGAS
jgi:hypothetical protein